MIDVTKKASTPTTDGPASYFSGTVKINQPFKTTEPARVSGATVSFSPGARTAWHTHPLGQTLIVIAGEGWVQEWGQEAQPIAAGDSVWIRPGVKHWHGAGVATSMTHVAIAEEVNGSAIDWLEQVTDAQYTR